MSFLISLFAFVITIGILVAIHEYGHFWVARKLGVKVLRYSVGFGKPIFTRTSKDADKVEYVLAAIPFGGYVKMLDEREGEVPEDQLHRAFNRQSVWKRIAIVLAGPLANFLFAILAYALMFMVGVDGLKPYVGEVAKGSPAEMAGFQFKDKITSINNEKVASLTDATLVLLDAYLSNPDAINVGVLKADGEPAKRVLDASGLSMLKDEGDYLEKVGIQPWLPYKPAIAKVFPGSVAEKAGFKTGDIVLAGNDKPFTSVKAFTDFVNNNAGKQITLRVQRQNDKDAEPVKLDIQVVPQLREIEGVEKGAIGIGVGRYIPEDEYARIHTVVRYTPLTALYNGARKTWQMSTMTLSMIGRLVTGDASLKNVSGPVTIANYAGKSMVIGFSVFLGFLAIVSLSLGVMNLLPVPVLDGGHLLFYIIELIKGSPVSEAVEEVGMRIGIAMVGSLMVLAFYNDILRLIK